MSFQPSPLSPATRDLAARIVDPLIEGPLSSRSVAVVADALAVRLVAYLTRWIGRDGVEVLLARALDRTRAHRTWLEPVTSAARTPPHFDRLAEVLAAREPEEAREAVVCLVGHCIELLGNSIGPELAQRLVWNATREVPAAPAHPHGRRHDW